VSKSLTVYPALTVDLPMRPNFLRADLNGEKCTIPVSRLTAEQLRDLGQAWTDALIEHANRQREKLHG
jgi:hypothetical protein